MVPCWDAVPSWIAAPLALAQPVALPARFRPAGEGWSPCRRRRALPRIYPGQTRARHKGRVGNSDRSGAFRLEMTSHRSIFRDSRSKRAGSSGPAAHQHLRARRGDPYGSKKRGATRAARRGFPPDRPDGAAVAKAPGQGILARWPAAPKTHHLQRPE